MIPKYAFLINWSLLSEQSDTKKQDKWSKKKDTEWITLILMWIASVYMYLMCDYKALGAFY